MTQTIDDILHERFGLREFRRMQREVIEAVLDGRDVLCVMPTGAGKSLCYQLPAVTGGGLTLVVSPLISLMEDQVRQLRDRGIAAAYLNSSQTAADQREVMQWARDGELRLLYVAPERFFSGGFFDGIAQLGVARMAIDEAHCISQWGHDFRPEYSRLGDVRQRLGNPPCVALTATATDDVREDIIHILGLQTPEVVVTGFDRPNLRYEARCLDRGVDKEVLIKQLLAGEPGSAIVYCSTRKTVDALADELAAELRPRLVVAYHAGLDAAERSQAQERFMRTPGAVAVATNAFGMGINKPDVRLVAHHDIPGTLEAYYQEAGRAGRDGAESRCVLIYHFPDRLTQEFFIEKLGQGDAHADPARIAEIKSHATAKLDLITRYARFARCRRQQILDYFGDEQTIENCNCDVCRGDLVQGEITPEVTLVVRQILSAIARLNGRFGIGVVADTLAGTPGERTSKWRLDSLSVFGLLKVHGGKAATRMIHRVIEAGLARQRDPEGMRRPIVEITPQGVAVMKAEQPPPGVLADLIAKRKPATIARPRRQATAIDNTIDHDPETLARFERLRQARGELAREHALPAYIICHDRTLAEIARLRPSNLEELELIKGIGPHKARMYGQKLLNAL